MKVTIRRTCPSCHKVVETVQWEDQGELQVKEAVTGSIEMKKLCSDCTGSLIFGGEVA